MLAPTVSFYDAISVGREQAIAGKPSSLSAAPAVVIGAIDTYRVRQALPFQGCIAKAAHFAEVLDGSAP